MTQLFMLWFADDYGLINGLFSLIIMFFYPAFIYICAYTCNEIKAKFIITSVSILLIFFLTTIIYFVSPYQIVNYGTNAQKEKMNYCIKQYQQSRKVDLNTIMKNHLLEVMQTCDDK